MSVALFQVHLKGSGEIFHVAAEGFHSGREQTKFDGVRKSARVFIFDGFVEFLTEGATVLSPSPRFPINDDPCFVPDYYYLPTDAVEGIFPYSSTYGSHYTSDFPRATTTPLISGYSYGWKVYLRGQGVGPEAHGAPFVGYPKRPIWLAGGFVFRPQTESDGHTSVSQAQRQLMLRWTDSKGYLEIFNDPVSLPVGFDYQYYIPIESVAAVLPITGPIHDVLPV